MGLRKCKVTNKISNVEKLVVQPHKEIVPN